MSKQEVRGFVLVESRGNGLGIDVRLERLSGACVLRAYRLGRPVAHATVSGARIGGACIVEVDTLSSELRRAVGDALDEGLRIYRDGCGLSEAA